MTMAKQIKTVADTLGTMAHGLGYERGVLAGSGAESAQWPRLVEARRNKWALEDERRDKLLRLKDLKKAKLIIGTVGNGETWDMIPCKESSRANLFKAIVNGDVTNSEMTGYLHAAPDAHGLDECESFLVSQDLASLIADKDVEGGEWRTPFDECIFEFQFKSGSSRLYVACYVNQPNQGLVCFIRCTKGGKQAWGASVVHKIDGTVCALEGKVPFLLAQFCAKQIRAACILMDAEVLDREQIRVDARLNEKREARGKLPLYSYHVLKLRRSINYHGLDLPHDDKRRSPRLHLRRGHWRRVGTHKTWVRWSVVGDESLGVVDKSYRL